MRIGIDLGGTKIEGVVMGPGSQIVARERVPTPQGDHAATVAAVAALVKRLEQGRGSLPVGIGHPGSLSPRTGLLRNSNSTCMNGKPLREDLQRALGREIRMANDADCLALSESHDGAAAGAATVFAAILGTGCGGGIVVNGALLNGANGIAGEWGHNPLPWVRTAASQALLASGPNAAPRMARPGVIESANVSPGTAPEKFAYEDWNEHPGSRCWCGKYGCLETWISGTGLSHDHRRINDEALDAATIAQRAERGDEKCLATLSRYENRLARALAQVINLIDPGVIVLGGGVSQIARLYQTVPALWSEWVFSDRVVTKLVPALHGDSSGVRGAARLNPE